MRKDSWRSPQIPRPRCSTSQEAKVSIEMGSYMVEVVCMAEVGNVYAIEAESEQEAIEFVRKGDFDHHDMVDKLVRFDPVGAIDDAIAVKIYNPVTLNL